MRRKNIEPATRRFSSSKWTVASKIATWCFVCALVLVADLGVGSRIGGAAATESWKSGLSLAQPGPPHQQNSPLSDLPRAAFFGRALLSTTSGGDCVNFEVQLSDDEVDFYTCCEGHMNISEAVPNWNCSPHHGGTRNDVSQYACGGIEGESLAREKCDTRWAWLAAESCFIWPVCFEGACTVRDELNRSASPVPFCGDGTCDTSSESTASCPADCCPLVSDQCRVVDNACPKACCNDGSCCRDTGVFCMEQLWLIVTSCAVVVANFICWCSFCICCSSKQFKCFCTGH